MLSSPLACLAWLATLVMHFPGSWDLNGLTERNTLTLTASVSSGKSLTLWLFQAQNAATTPRYKLPSHHSAGPEQFPKWTDCRMLGYCFILFCAPIVMHRLPPHRLEMRNDGWLRWQSHNIFGCCWRESRAGRAGDELGELSAVLKQ